MTKNQFDHSNETRALAALYALGSLAGEERVLFEEHLNQGCSLCEQEIRSLDGVAQYLSLSVPSAAPSDEARKRLINSIRVGQEPKASSRSQESLVSKGILLQQPGLLISRSEYMPWQDVAPGISRKLLFVDSDRHYNTSLIRLQAGTRYPSHRHADVEEILVLEGDLHLHGVVMHPGDYCRAEPESIHQETFSESGCVLLQLTSQHDQIEV